MESKGLAGSARSVGSTGSEGESGSQSTGGSNAAGMSAKPNTVASAGSSQLDAVRESFDTVAADYAELVRPMLDAS